MSAPLTPDDAKRQRDDAFRAEAIQWLPDVARFALSLTREEADADDLVQETYLKAYEAWHTYSPGTECRGWLFTTRPSAGGSAGAAPAMLDCESVMRQLWDYLDGELTPDRMEAMRQHLDMCKRCYPQFQFERSFLDLVASSAPRHSDLERLRRGLLATLEAKGLGRQQFDG
jgi:DNA-directed RNA polymerase specialized sigma subunit, sigma24 homolog